MNKYLDNGWTLSDIALPLGIVTGAVVLGVVVEYIVRRILNGHARKKGWTVGRALIRSFRGMPTIWFGLIALKTELNDFQLNTKAEHLIGIIITILTVFSITILLTRVATALVRNYSSRSAGVGSRITILENVVRIVIYIFGILTILHNLGVSITPILTALGVGGLAVALALQDTLSNLFAGLYIIMSKQIDPGDYVKLESGQEGTIIDIAWRVTTLRTPANTMIIIPNSKFASSILTNFERPETISTIAIPFELKSSVNLDEISIMLVEIAKAVIASSEQADKAFTPTVAVVGLNDSTISIMLTLGVSEYRGQNKMRSAVYKKFFEQLKAVKGDTAVMAPPPPPK